MKILSAALLSVLIFSSATLAENKHNIVATIGMVGDIVKNVAGEKANVTYLLGSGVDPHLYKPTRTDIAKLLKADIVFYNGLLLEGKMADALIRVATAGKKVHAVTELLDESYLLEPEGFSGHYDPHVWMDPRAWSQAVIAVKEKLIEFDNSSKDTYEKNAESYLQELNKLDAYAENILNSLDKKSRVLVTAHDAFNYFGKRFEFEVLGIQGLSTESEAGVKDIEKIVDTLVSRDIKAVFVESTVADRNIKALIEGASAKGHKVKIGGELFSDAMGKPGSYEGTYIGMIDHNVTTIARALGGEAPEKGLNKKLSNH